MMNMNEEKVNSLTFNAHFIENVEISHEVSTDCKLRSKFVHERILNSRTKDAEYSVILLIYERGLKVLRQLDKVLLSSHCIQRISYSACDRVNQLFALVVRSSEVGRGQSCLIFRMDSSEQADAINRYFGNTFKLLHKKKKERKSQSALSNAEKSQRSVERYENVPELMSALRTDRRDSDSANSADGGADPRFRQISTSNISELVSEKHHIRRLSLCMPVEVPDDMDVSDLLEPLHPSLKKAGTGATSDNNARPLVRKKKSEHKGNRISAVIERWSFRGGKDLSSDILKSGSPVVALKEQLEYEELLSGESSLGSEPRQYQAPCIPRSTSKKQLLPSHSNLYINNDSKAASNLVRKNSAPLCNQLEDEQPPVPPIRIHSLRNTAFPRTLAVVEATPFYRSFGEGASNSMPEQNDEDDHLSSITTPSSCDQGDSEPVRFGIYNEPPPPSRIYRDPASSRSKNNSSSMKETVHRPTPIVANSQTSSSSVPIQYFKDFSKEEAMEYLLDKEIGSFLLRHSASQRGCMALSVKVAENLVSHYIIQKTAVGCQMKGLDKTWPNVQSLVTHLSVIPEMLPCPIRIPQQGGSDRKTSAPTTTYFTADVAKDATAAGKGSSRVLGHKLPPQSQSADDEYKQRMQYFLSDLSPTDVTVQDQYQQLSDFSSFVASLDLI